MNKQKIYKIIGWVLLVLMGIMFSLGIVLAFLKPEVSAEGMQKYGIPQSAALPIAVVEFVCGLLFLIPQTSALGGVLATGYLGGAVMTHVRAGEPFIAPIVVGVVIWVGLALRDPGLGSFMPLRKK